MPILTLHNVTVARGDFVLCDGVNLTLGAGDICHLVGQNGLGKTTLLMQITGILPTLSGQIDYQGKHNAKGAVYVSHQTGIHENLSVAQNLSFLVALYGICPTSEEIEVALAQVGLAGFGDVKVGELSAGQGRRVGLARLWLLDTNHAPLWVLDEPLTALDVAMVIKLSGRIIDFAKSGGAVLITSHQALDIATMTVNLTDFVQMTETDKDNSDD